MSLSLTFLKSESPLVFSCFYIVFQVALQVAVRRAFRGRTPVTVVFHLVEEEVSHQTMGLLSMCGGATQQQGYSVAGALSGWEQAVT